jgi:hypothetical protein
MAIASKKCHGIYTGSGFFSHSFQRRGLYFGKVFKGVMIVLHKDFQKLLFSSLSHVMPGITGHSDFASNNFFPCAIHINKFLQVCVQHVVILVSWLSNLDFSGISCEITNKSKCRWPTKTYTTKSQQIYFNNTAIKFFPLFFIDMSLGKCQTQNKLN